MKVGSLVKEKYITERLGVVVAVRDHRCKVIFTDGDTQWNNTYHFWELSIESR
jgi:hypothetical protein